MTTQQYRSNLKTATTMLEEMQLKPQHITQLKKTPFWILIDSIRKGSLKQQQCRKSDQEIQNLISSFNPKKQAFIVNKKPMELTTMDIRLIFGILDGKEEIEVNLRKQRKPKGPGFVSRRFEGANNLSSTCIKEALEDALQGKKKKDYEDVARLITLMLLVSVFVPTTTHSIGWAYAEYVENMEHMANLNWSEHIHQVLHSSLMKKSKTPSTVSGCVIAIPYWVCEHIAMFEKVRTSGMPRCANWDLRDFNRTMKNEFHIDSLDEQKIIRHNLTPTNNETKTLRLAELESENDSSNENSESSEKDSSSKEESDTSERNGSEDGNDDSISDESEKADMSGEDDEDDEDSIAERMGMNLAVEDDGKVIEDQHNEDREFDMPSFDLIDRMDDTSYPTDTGQPTSSEAGKLKKMVDDIVAAEKISSLEHQLAKAKESNHHAQATLLASNTKMAEILEKLHKEKEKNSIMQMELKDTHKRVMTLEDQYNKGLDKLQQQEIENREVTDAEKKRIEVLEAQVAYLENENFKLRITEVEPLNSYSSETAEGAQVSTRETRPIDPSSLVRRVKTREQRAAKQDDQYTYGKQKGKRGHVGCSKGKSSTGEENKEEENPDFDTIDIIPATKVPKIEQKGGPSVKQAEPAGPYQCKKNLSLYADMENDAANRYKKLRKECPPDHEIWKGKRDDSFVRVEDLAAMVRKVGLSENLMNAYADILDMQIGLTVTSTYKRRFYIFDTSCWKYITENTPESIIKRKQKIDAVLEKMSYPRHMMFPFQVSLQKAGEAERWALLCFDTEVHLWTHYNPVVRKDDDFPDNSGWQITQMKQYIETKMKEGITQSTISRGWITGRKNLNSL